MYKGRSVQIVQPYAMAPVLFEFEIGTKIS